MKKLLLLLLLVPMVSFGQLKSSLNGYKYAVLRVDSFLLIQQLKAIGIKAYYNNEELPNDLVSNECLGVYVSFENYRGGNGRVPAFFTDIVFRNCLNNTIFKATERHQTNYGGAQSKSIKRLKSKLKYSFNPSLVKTSKTNSPSDAIDYYNRGYDKYDLKDYYGAIDDYSKAIELDPDFAYAYSNRGTAKKNLKDYYGAINDYSKVIELDPNYTDAYVNRGVAKESLGDLKGACADWRKAASLGDKDAAQWVRDQCN